MYPNNVSTQEPLARDLAMKAARKEQRRRSSVPLGLADTVEPGDSLSSQAAMDTLQSSTVSEPAARSPFMVASMSGESGGAPAGAIMTAQYRDTGGAQAPIRTVQCRNGRCGVPQTSMYNEYNAPMGGVVTSFNGVPMDGGAFGPPPAAFTPPPASVAPSIPTAAPARASVPIQGGGPSPDDLIELSDQQLGSAIGAAQQPGLPAIMRAASDVMRSRDTYGTALDMAAAKPAYDLGNRSADQYDRWLDIEERAQERNLETQWYSSVPGAIANFNALRQGSGMYRGMTPEERATEAAQIARVHQKPSPDGQPVKTEQQYYEHYLARAYAHDIAHGIALGSALQKDGSLAFDPGLRPYLDEQIMNRYGGVADPEKKRILVGGELSSLMHKDLDKTVSLHLARRISRERPDLSSDDLERFATQEAFRIVSAYAKTMNAVNMKAQAAGLNPAWKAYESVMGGFRKAVANQPTRVPVPKSGDTLTTPPRATEQPQQPEENATPGPQQSRQIAFRRMYGGLD